MIRAVLFDLDGTLLDIDMEAFLPHYLKSLAARVGHLLGFQAFTDRLLAATQKMIDNDGRATNEEVFARAFYPLAGHPREELEPIFLEFYARDYPALQRFARRKPEARPVVQAAFELGYTVVVATAPLFPATAVAQRLAWAGVGDFPYRLVTAFENSRASKPNLLYYENILRELDLQPEQALIVGNETMDMVAGRLGCPTFLVLDHSRPLDPALPPPTYQGSLPDLQRLLERLRREAHP